MRKSACLLLSIACVVGCGVDEPVVVDDSAPDSVGSYAVGVTTVEIDDGTGSGRTLPIEIWYPAAPSAQATAEVYQLMIGTIPLAQLESPLGAVRDAPGAAGVGRRPVVVFSHGNGGVRIQSLFLTEHLASHGFVVAAPDHVGNTMAAMVNKSALPAVDAAKLRPGDTSRALDALIAADADPASPIHGLVDASRAAITGHSFGGFTTLRDAGATIDVASFDDQCSSAGGLLCDGWTAGDDFPPDQRDPRFLAAAAQAPGGADVIRDGFKDVAIPTLIMDGTLDRTTPWEPESLAPYQELGVPSELVIIDRAGHFTFSDMCLLLEQHPDLAGLTGGAMDDGCGSSNVPAADAHRIVNGFITSFFQHHLEGRSGLDAWLVPTAPLPAGVARWEAR